MGRKRPYSRRNLAVVLAAVLIMLIALVSCFHIIQNINGRMNESATSNLLNTTRVIESTLEQSIGQDFDSLQIVGEFYKKREELDEAQLETLRDSMGFTRLAVVDAQGDGAGCLKGRFQASDLPCYAEWTPEKKGYSDAYLGESGRLQTTLWLPVYRSHRYIGTVFGDVALSKYYADSVFTFYEGDGRTYLFDMEDGSWILRNLDGDGAARRHDNIYSLLLSSGNDVTQVEAFQRAVQNRRTGTADFAFNGKQSFVCYMPLSSSTDWYLVTVVPKAVLLRESAQVRQMIQWTFTIFCAALLFFATAFCMWRIRKTKEQEASYREALFLNVSSNIESAFLIYEKHAAVFVSENVSRVLGLSRRWLEEDAGRLFDWCRIPQGDTQRAAFLAGTMREPAVREVCVAGALHTRYIRLELIPADWGQEIAVLTDITADKDIQQSLIDAMRRAESASHAKNDFLSSMSHDIRTPMNGIVGMTAIAAAHADDPARVRDCLSKISEASAHLLTIINEVLDMSQIESGKIELMREPFNLAALLQDVLSLSYPAIRQKNHTVQVHIHPMRHEQVIGDPARLKRAVSNLISNAVKYTPDGGVITLGLQELPPVVKGYGCYELTVQDNGIGMSREFQEKLFQPFEREEDVRISRIQGTGLGMSIVQNIISLMMGEIEVESEKHRGTTFRVTVNLLLDEQPDTADEALAELPVLVVDDDRVTCESVAGMLRDIGMAGDWVDNGFEAVERVAAARRAGADYLAVLLDWKMPGMDGVETARRIRAAVGRDVPIIILTAYEWHEIEDEARRAGVDAFLSKPIYKAKLRLKMQEIAARPAARPETPAPARDGGFAPGKRVLLAEDNALNQEIAAELLHMLHVETDCAEDGVQAVERFSESAPGTYDLILMDIQMPRMNGYEAAKAIRGLGRPDSASIPIVAMTADAFAQDIQHAHAAGMNEHIAKPIALERLQQVLARFLWDGGGGR